MEHWGRKRAMQCFAVISTISGALLAASQDSAMFIVFRFFSGLGSWAFLCISKSRHCRRFYQRKPASKFGWLIVTSSSTCLLLGISPAALSRTDGRYEWSHDFPGILDRIILWACVQLLFQHDGTMASTAWAGAILPDHDTGDLVLCTGIASVFAHDSTPRRSMAGGFEAAFGQGRSYF